MERGELKKDKYPVACSPHPVEITFEKLGGLLITTVLLKQSAKNGQQLAIGPRRQGMRRQQCDALVGLAAKLKQTPHAPQGTDVFRVDLQRLSVAGLDFREFAGSLAGQSQVCQDIGVFRQGDDRSFKQFQRSVDKALLQVYLPKEMQTASV